jgi:DnaJ-class molecular chaperone
MTQDDYYATLGLPPQADPRQVKEAYRRLAFEHHPDRNRDTPSAADTMKRINEAYAVLSHPAKRREYDALRERFGSAAHSRFRTSHTEQDIFSGSDINAVFEELARSFGFRGFEDIFRDVYGQAPQGFEFKRPRVTIRTFGFGRHFRSGGGSGALPPSAGILGRLARLALDKLGGGLPQNGADIHDRIGIRPELASAGGPYAYLLRPVSKKLVVKIPPGVRAGQRIRLTGMGMPGRNGGKNGDLFLEVRLRRPFRARVKNFIAGILGKK